MFPSAMPDRMIQQRPPSLRSVPGLVLLGSLAALAIAFPSQYLGGLQPCQLCIWQRWGYAATIALALATFALPSRQRPYGAALAALGLLATAGLALFHAGREYHLWQGLASCNGNLDTSQSLDVLEQQLLATPVVPLDLPDLTMIGNCTVGYDSLHFGA